MSMSMDVADASARRRSRARRLVACLGVLGSAAIVSAAPAMAFEPTICQDDGDWQARVAVGASAWLSGSYTDWAEPGEIRAVFRGPLGQRKVVEDVVDGAAHWEMSVWFRASETGRWAVTTTFSEPHTKTVTCKDHIQVVGLGTPDTSVYPGQDPETPPPAPVPLLLAGLIGLGLTLRRLGRRGGGPLTEAGRSGRSR